jgi:hypothetical protein
MRVSESDFRPFRPAAAVCLAVVLAGGVALGAGLFLAPQRAWLGAFVACNFLLGLGLGGLLFVALTYVTGAKWTSGFRRVPEAMTAALPAAAVGMAVLVPVLFFGYSTWAPAAASAVPLRRLWLNPPFFLARSLVYVVAWLAFAAAIVRNARRQDAEGGTAPKDSNRLLSAFFLVAFGLTCWLSSTDWLMSLTPNWASTVYGVYNFSGLFLSALAALTLLVIWLRARGPLRAAVTADHLHDLGTLLFSFSGFWMYIWFCQYLLIWYVNNPEETAYFLDRVRGPWAAWLLLDLALNWAAPFVVLLFRRAKRNPWTLGAVAILLLVGRWVDLSLMVLPGKAGASGPPGLMEAGLALGAVGVFVLAVLWGLHRAPLVPHQEPAQT